MALNDPQWGNRKNGGPPDLEEMLRNLNKKIAGLLGGKGGGEPSHGSTGSGIGVIVAIVALVWLGSGSYIVDASQRGVVLRFGKYLETTEAGWRWHWPYPIETVEVVNMGQVRTVEVGYRDNAKNKRPQEALMLTDDENIIDIQFAVQYVLKDPKDYLFNNRMADDRGKDRDKEIVRQAAETAIREVVGKNKMDFVLYEGRGQVTADTTKLIQDILDRYKSGILVSQVNMQQAQPPEQVQAAFDDAVKAKQDKERQKNEGLAYANNVVPNAKGAAARLMQEAEGYKKETIARAEGDASRFKLILAEYNKAPQVTRERMYIDMMQQILSSSSKVLVDQKNGNSLLYLPLDKLIQSTNPGAQQLPEMQPAAKPADTQTGSDSRSGDATLGRDRRARP
ncbi:MAG TPA: FtsH protease activity modulator HflK [Gallionellaceae bacterium]